MDITKISFNEAKYGAAFETLDVNSDNVINEDDLSATQDSTIKSKIQQLLNDFDEEAELSTKASSTGTNKYGLKETDADNFENDVTNSKGTVYVVMGNLSGCGYCHSLEKEIQKNADALNGVATVYDLDWNSNSSLCRSIYKQGGGGSGASFPQVAKFVDGKFVELLDNPRKAAATVQEMISGAESTKSSDSASSSASTSSTASTGSTSTTSSTSTTTSTGLTESASSTISTLTTEKTSNLAKIAEYQEELDENVLVIGELDTKINSLSKEVKDDIAKANEEVAQIIKEKEAKFQAAIDEAVEEAKNQKVADGEEPKSFSDILSGKMTSDLNISGDVLTAMVSAITSSSKVAQIETYVNEMSTLNTRNITLNTEIETLTNRNTAIDTEISSLKASATTTTTSTTASTSTCCDPIGFTNDGNQYDFFVDKDNNGKLSDENEFLGASNQWTEMSALDTDGDNKVSKEELNAGNVQMVKTDADGNQSVVNVADVFGDSDYVDLSSYEQAEDGALYNNNEKQTLLGNFNVNLSGEDIQGYNTLDDVDWLKETYKFDATAADSKAGDTENAFANTDTVAENVEQYKKDVEEMNTLIKTTWTDLGVSESAYNAFTTSLTDEGKAEATAEIATLKEEAEEAVKAKKTTEETEE